MQHKTYKAAIFDMDGTVLNTLEDLTSALNYVLAETGHAHAYGTAQVRQFFGSGVQVALTRVLAIEKGIASYDQLEYVGQDGDAITPRVDAQEVSRIQDIFRPYYAAHCAIQTGEYAGISQLLGHLRAAGIQTAVVSNKPDLAVQKLTADYFQGLFDLALGEQPQIRRKPAPDMVLKALKDLGLTPEQAVYIGDSEIDIETAKSAGLDCLSVTWGFRSKTFLQNHGACVLVDTPEEIAKFF